MQLVPCSAPKEPLEDAPQTALVAEHVQGDGGSESWDGFWSSDAYFIRCTRENGEIEWFQLADEDGLDHAAQRADGGRVLTFPTKARLQTRVILAKSPAGRGMLVGSAQRASARRTAE